MDTGPFGALIWGITVLVVAVLFIRQRRRRRHVGSAAAGTVYDWLNEEKRNAVEIVVEDRAAERDHEHVGSQPPDAD